MIVELGPSQRRVLVALEGWRRQPPYARFGNHLLLGMRGVGKTALLHYWGGQGVEILSGPNLFEWLIERYSSPFALLPGQLAAAVIEYARARVPERGWGAVVDAWCVLQPFLCNRNGDLVGQFLRALEETQTGYRLLVWEFPTDGPGLPESSILKNAFDARVRVDHRERAIVLPFTTEDALVLYAGGQATSSTVESYYEARLSLSDAR